MSGDEVFTIQARRCKRCGRLLTSQEAVERGYGCQCAMFLSLADKEKYQDADQEERFRCVDRHIACARHALGLDKDGHRRTYRGLIYFHSWRNFYDAGGDDIEIMEDLAKWGFAGKNSSGTYYITRDGRLWLTKVCDDVDVIRGVNG